MSETVIVAALSLIGTVTGSVLGIIASNKVTLYRIEQLEKKVDKHNSVIERTYLLEEKMKETERRLEKIEDIT
ncbi:MAG: hypothetical protein ACI4F5_07585 [Acutalibacteraceae bacterium]